VFAVVAAGRWLSAIAFLAAPNLASASKALINLPFAARAMHLEQMRGTSTTFRSECRRFPHCEPFSGEFLGGSLKALRLHRCREAVQRLCHSPQLDAWVWSEVQSFPGSLETFYGIIAATGTDLRSDASASPIHDGMQSMTPGNIHQQK